MMIFIGIILVTLGIAVAALSWYTRHLPSLLVAAALVVAGVWNENMSGDEWWAFTFIIIVGSLVTWPKNWARIQKPVRQWITGAVVLVLTILMAWNPDNLFGNGFGWASLFAFAAVALFALGSALLLGIFLILAVVVLVVTGALQSVTSWMPVPRPPAVTTSVTPSPIPSVSATPVTPSPIPSATSSKPELSFTIPSEAMVTNNMITTWKELDSLTDTTFRKVVDESKPYEDKLRTAKTWNSPVDDARLVVVFAPVAEISDEQARKLVHVDSKTWVARAQKCYSPYSSDKSLKKVCPMGNERAILTLAPSLRDSEGLGLVDDWGVAIFDTDDGYVHWPITYQ